MKEYLIISLFYFFFVNSVLAHSGRTDANGCHHDYKYGTGYHCHGGSGSSGGSAGYTNSNHHVKSIKQVPQRTKRAIVSTPVTQQNKGISASAGNDISDNLVFDIQLYLDFLGYDIGSLDGILGKKTNAAIGKFKENQNVNTSSLIELKSVIKNVMRNNFNYYASDDLIFDNQLSLIWLGYDVNGVDGIIGSKTKLAIQQFKISNNIDEVKNNFDLKQALIGVIQRNRNIKNDDEFNKYLNEYAEESAKYQICGEYDRLDIANLGIYFDDILSPLYLKEQIRKYGSQEKASYEAVDRAQNLADKYQHRLVNDGVPRGMCAKLLKE